MGTDSLGMSSLSGAKVVLSLKDVGEAKTHLSVILRQHQGWAPPVSLWPLVLAQGSVPTCLQAFD